MDRENFKLPAAEVRVPIAVEMVGEIEAIAFGPRLLARANGPAGTTRPGNAAETSAAAGVFKAETEMAVVEGARRSRKAGIAGEKERFGVAETEGCKLLERAEEIGCDIGEAEFEVAAYFFLSGGEVELSSGQAREGFTELWDVSGGEGEADGMGMATEAREECVVVLFMSRGEGVEEMKARDRAAGAMGGGDWEARWIGALFMREDKCGAVGAFDDTRGEDAEHATMPAGVEDDFGIGRRRFHLSR